VSVLDYDVDAQAFAETVAAYCDKHADQIRAAGAHPGEPWRELAALGLFDVASVSPGGASVVAAVMERLGRAVLGGPLVATYMACLLLGDGESSDLRSGAGFVSLGRPPLMPWAPVATVFIEVVGGEAWLCRPAGEVEEVSTLAGEPWGRCALEHERELDHPGAALALGDIALAAYLAGAGEYLLDEAAGYAAQRHQFGRPIGDFQAVAHPLAAAAAHLTAARTLARLAAYRADRDGLAAAACEAATARLSATAAALRIAYQAHQTYGAMGFTVEGPVALASHRIRQESLVAPGPRAAREVVLAALGI
jgi:alkylation response protein AidB-like acyl-CoA dehydrogenase